MLEKLCSKCKLVKEETHFTKNVKGTYGLNAYCKACAKIYNYNRNIEKRKTKKHHSSKLCHRCDKEHLSTSKYCLRCLIGNAITRGYIEKGKRLELIDKLIQKLEKAEYTCFYTGIKLVPGLNMSLDHKIPLNKGGENTIENLEWVHIGVNFMKNEKTEKEFISSHASFLVEYSLLASKGVL